MERLATTTKAFLATMLVTAGIHGGHASAGVIASYSSSLGTLPTSQGWQLTDTGGSPTPFMDGGSLHQGPTAFSKYQYWSQDTVPFDFATDTVTVKGTLKVISSTLNTSPVTRAGYDLYALDAAGRVMILNLASNNLFINSSGYDSPSAIVSFDSTDAFHTYRMVINASGASVFIDGAIAPIVTLALGATGQGGANTVLFGDGTGYGSNESLTTSFEVSINSVPEIDPAGMGSVLALVAGAVGLLERRRRRSP